MSPKGPRKSRTKRRLFILLVLAVLLIPTYYWVANMVERSGWQFFNTGKSAVDTLGRMAQGMKTGDFSAVEACFADSYAGQHLGLANQQLTSERDGVRIAAFTSDGSAADRQSALDEWRAYLAGFEQVDEVGLYVHRLESWKDPEDIVLSARFELIGKPHGAPRSGIDRGFFRLRFTTTPEGLRITGGELIEGDRVINSGVHFTNVAAAAGIDFENRYYPRFLSDELKFGMLRYGPAGISAVDVDNDGFHDLFIPDGVESKLLRNRRDGSFEDITAAAGLSGLSGVSVGLFADYDNDGHKDFFVSRTFEPNQLFRNDGDGTFTDVTSLAGIGEDCCTTVGSWGDYDNDGLLDLYVGRYLDPRLAIPTTFYARNGEPNQLYRNNGDGTFTNVTEDAGVGELGLCLGTVFGDYDDDGDGDIYAVGGKLGTATLWHNEGDGTFTDAAIAATSFLSKPKS